MITDWWLSRRRSEYDLEKAKQRAHILEGLRIAINNLDEIIKIIRNSPDAEEAKVRLIKRFKLSDIQAQAILDMPSTPVGCTGTQEDRR